MTDQIEHIEEKTLALYVLHAPEVEERKEEIAHHLQGCQGCTALLKQIEGYYGDFEEVQESEAHALLPSAEIAGKLIRNVSGDIQPLHAAPRQSIVKAFSDSLRTYPLRWSSAFAVVAAALLFILPKVMITDRSPSFVRAVNEFLVAMNKDSRELWRVYVGPGFEHRSSKVSLATVSQLWDVDGGGKNSVFLLYPRSAASPEDYQSTSIASYSPGGDERWRFQFHPPMTFGKTSFSGDYYLVNSLSIGDYSATGHFEIPFAAHHFVWWPAAVGLLDARSGQVVGQYWNPGWVKIGAGDIDRDGVTEIIAAGYSNSYKLNMVAVLDPRKLNGHAPASEEFVPAGIPPAQEKYYILLPDPDLYHFSMRIAVEENVGISPVNNLEIRTIRYLNLGKENDLVAELFFEFDEHMNCTKVRPGDEFGEIHRRFEREGRVRNKLDTEYFETLRRGLLYWDGERFVKEPTMNKKYVSNR
ncbi:MAG TPA: hypothetical protein VMH23_06520 [Bacteroidota bacterium]|nr:hypothetical protein [Bacteroidota bacterium]